MTKDSMDQYDGYHAEYMRWQSEFEHLASDVAKQIIAAFRQLDNAPTLIEDGTEESKMRTANEGLIRHLFYSTYGGHRIKKFAKAVRRSRLKPESD